MAWLKAHDLRYDSKQYKLENVSSGLFVFAFFFNVGGFLQSSAQPHESVARSLQRATGHIKGTRPPC